MTTTTFFDFHSPAEESRITNRSVLDALQRVEAHMVPPDPGRERGWLALLAIAMDDLADAVAAKAASDAEYTGLLAEIELREPRFTNQIATVRQLFADIAASVDRVRARIDASHVGPIDVHGLREDIADIAREVRFHRAAEADLVYEAVNVDLGAGD